MSDETCTPHLALYCSPECEAAGTHIKRPTRVLLYSGGMDSYCLREIWKPDHLVYVDMGTGYTGAEMAHLPPGTHIHHLALGGFERDNAIIPLRNLFLLALAAQYGEDGDEVEVALGATAGDRSLDKDTTFADMAGDLMSYAWSKQWWTVGKDVRVVLPAKNLSKGLLVRDYLEAGGVAGDLVEQSFSCYEPDMDTVDLRSYGGVPVGKLTTGARACGSCKPCVRKWVALASNGIQSTPDCYEQAKQWHRNDMVRDVERDDWDMALANASAWRKVSTS